MSDKLDSSLLTKGDATNGATAAFQSELISAPNIGSKNAAAATRKDSATPQVTGKDLAHDVNVNFNAHPDIFTARQLGVGTAGALKVDVPKVAGTRLGTQEAETKIPSFRDGDSKTRGLGAADSEIGTRGFGRPTDAPPEKDLRKTAADAQASLDQMNTELKANLTPDQSAKLRKLESSVLSGDLEGVQSALDSMRPTSDQDPTKAASDNAAIMSAFSADMKAAGIAANFEGAAGQDEGFFGSLTPNQSLHLSDHFPENFDQFYNQGFTDLIMYNASEHSSVAEQSIPNGPTTTPGFEPVLASQALYHLGELAQQNLSSLPPPSNSPLNPQQ